MSNGLNDFASNSEMRQGLRADFTPAQIIKVQKAKGVPVDTVSHAIITDRLNDVAPGWTYKIEEFITINGIWVKPNTKRGETFEPYNDGQPHLLAVFGSMTIGSVTRYEVGEVDGASTYGAELKRAISDFIKRGAMRFGVGIALKSKEIAVQTRNDSNAGVVEVAAVPGAVGSGSSGQQGGPAEPDPTPADVGLEERQAWDRLLAMNGNSATKATNHLNRVNQSQYTSKTAPCAKLSELQAAIAGEVA